MNIPFDISTSPDVIKPVLIISLTILAAIILDNLFRSYIKAPQHLDNKHSRKYFGILRSLITIIVYIVAAYVILLEIGVNITPLLASAGIVGVIVGISLRQVLEDLINGIFLLSQDLITVGDYIKIDDAEGYIETIGFRMLSIRREDGALYLIPNGQVKKVINFSRHSLLFFVDVTIKANQKIDRVLSAMQEALIALQKDKDVGPYTREGSLIEGVQNYTADGRMVMRAKLITSASMRHQVAAKFRYLVKKNFEEKRLTIT